MAAFGDEGLAPESVAAIDEAPGRRRRGAGARAADLSRAGRRRARRASCRSQSRSSASTRLAEATIRRHAARRRRGPRRTGGVRRARDGTARRRGRPPARLRRHVPGRRRGTGLARGQRDRRGRRARSSESGGRTVIVPLRTAQRLLGDEGVSRVDIIVGEGATPAEVSIGAGGRADHRAIRPLVAPGPRRVAERSSTADFRATTALIAAVAAVRRGVPDLQHAVDDGHGADPGARPAASGRRDARPARRGSCSSRRRCSGWSVRSSGSAVGVGLARRSWPLYVRRSGRSRSTRRPAGGVGSVLIAVAIGLFVTLAASLEPARRAAAISPVEALKARLDPASARRARLRWLVGVFVAVGCRRACSPGPRAAPAPGSSAPVAVYTLLLVVVLASPCLLGGIAAVAGLPFSRHLPTRGAAGPRCAGPRPEPDGPHGRGADGGSRDDRRDRRRRGPRPCRGERLAGRGDPRRRAAHLDPAGRLVDEEVRSTSSPRSTAWPGSARSPRSRSRSEGVRTDAAAVVGSGPARRRPASGSWPAIATRR